MSDPRAPWSLLWRRPDASVSGFRRARVTWCLALASMLGFFALPALFQELYIVHRSGRPWDFAIEQRAAGEVWWRGADAWACILCAACLLLAHFLPRFWHRRVLSRLRLPAVDRVHLAGPWSYRTAPVRTTLLGREAMNRLDAAYLRVLGLTLLMLWPPLWLASLLAFPTRWHSAVMGCGYEYAAPDESLPVFVVATFVLLLCSPRTARLLGPLAASFERGAVDFTMEAEAKGIFSR